MKIKTIASVLVLFAALAGCGKDKPSTSSKPPSIEVLKQRAEKADAASQCIYER